MDGSQRGGVAIKHGTHLGLPSVPSPSLPSAGVPEMPTRRKDNFSPTSFPVQECPASFQAMESPLAVPAMSENPTASGLSRGPMDQR